MDRYHFNARQFERDKVAITADIRVSGRGRNAIKVIELSRSGFRTECLTHIPNDKLIFLTIPGFFQLECHIAWRTEWVYGFEFECALHPAVYDHIVRKHPGLVSEPVPDWLCHIAV